MKPIEVSIRIPAPPGEVWAEVEKVEEHPAWMADAVDVEFESDTRRGVGTRITVLTRIGPLKTTDAMEFTEWDPPKAMGVAHRGLFTGSGRFTLEPDGEGTRFTWTETIRFPWFLGGRVGALVARPILTRVWKGNLRRLRDRLSGP
jgi:carbon monoxide dehydrogenase subunit G